MVSAVVVKQARPTYSVVEFGFLGIGNNWCGTSVEFRLVAGVNFGTSVEILFLWCVVEIRGRFVRGVSGN